MKKILVIIMVIISLFSLLVFGCACNKNGCSCGNTEVTKEDPGENGGNTEDPGYTIVQPISNGGSFNGGNYN